MGRSLARTRKRTKKAMAARKRARERAVNCILEKLLNNVEKLMKGGGRFCSVLDNTRSFEKPTEELPGIHPPELQEVKTEYIKDEILEAELENEELDIKPLELEFHSEPTIKDEPSKEAEPQTAPSPTPSSRDNKTQLILQLKIQLRYINPPIWRRVQIPEKYNFHQLHLLIQHAMGWKLCHAHQFEVINKETGNSELIVSRDVLNYYSYFDGEVLEEEKTCVSKYLKKAKHFLLYEYDNGDGWEHDVVVEKILSVSKPAPTSFPKLLDGMRACPPEDCGGPEAYEYLLQVLKNPKHEGYKEKLEWLEEFYPGFNSEHFDSAPFMDLMNSNSLVFVS